VSSCVPWTIEDIDGDNPRGAPGTFDFNVWYELNAPEYGAPQIEIIGVTCTRAEFNAAQDELVAAQDREQLAEWFDIYLNTHPDELAAIQDQARIFCHIDLVN
jgi:hypothetical protein